MNLFIWHAIPSDVLVDRFTMFLIVAESIENLGQCEVRQPPYDFLGATPNFHNSAIARTGVRVPVTMGAPWRISSVQTM